MGIITITILSFVPAAFYAFIIYITVPYKTINFKVGLSYLFGGLLAVGLLMYFNEAVPGWRNLSDYLSNAFLHPLHYFHIENFIQIGFIEELSKLCAFFIIEKIRRNNGPVNDHPLGTMFYVGMVSLGFAIVENVSYGTNSITPVDTIMWRSFTAVIGHMVFGMFMGYWISLGRVGPRLKNRSILDVIILKRDNLRKRLFIFMGLGAATILHGIYDLHITINGNAGITSLYMLLIMSLLGVFWCFNNIYKVHSEKLKEKVDN